MSEIHNPKADSSRNPGNPWALGILALGIALSCFLWLKLRENDHRAIQIEAAGRAREAVHSIDAGLKNFSQALERRAASWDYRQGISAEEWKADSHRLLQDSPSVFALALASEAGVIERALSLYGGVPPVGHRLDTQPSRQAALQEARALGKPAASRLIQTFETKANGFILAIPLLRKGRPDGFFVAAFRLQELLPAFTSVKGYRFSVYDAAGAPLFQEKAEGRWESRWKARAPLTIGPNSWIVEAIPSEAAAAALRTNFPLVGFSLGIIFTLFLAALIREMGARRAAEKRMLTELEERLQAKRKFKLLFDNCTDAQFLIDENGIIDCNPSTVRVLGARNKEEVIGTHPARFSPATQPDGKPSLPQTDLINEGIRKNGSHRFEWTHCRLDGTPFRTEVTVIAVQYEGRMVQLVSWHDLTERIAAEEKFRLLFEHSKDAHFLMSEEGILECNPATLNLFGASTAAEVPASNLALLRGSQSLPANDSGVRALEQNMNRQDGRDFPALITLKEVSYRGKKVFLTTVQDLSEQKNTQARLLETSKMSSLGEMASGMAHELNTPLAVIKAKADLLTAILEEKEIPRAELIRQLAIMDKMVIRMATIIKSLRFFARESSKDSLEYVRVETILQETLALCQARFANNSIELKVEGEKSHMLYCRPVQVSQILLNLLGNAFDAVANQTDKTVRIAVVPGSAGLELSVEDHGPGIPPELRGKIMQPFFTTKEVGKGTGLGLSISTGLAASNGGKLYLDEACPHTRFVLLLPIPETKSSAKLAS